MVRFKESRMFAVTQFCCTGQQIKRANVVRKGKKENNPNQLETGEEAGVQRVAFPLSPTQVSFRLVQFLQPYQSYLTFSNSLITSAIKKQRKNEDHLGQVEESSDT